MTNDTTKTEPEPEAPFYFKRSVVTSSGQEYSMPLYLKWTDGDRLSGNAKFGDVLACLEANTQLRAAVLSELFGLGRKDREAFWAELPLPVTGHIAGLKLELRAALSELAEAKAALAQSESAIDAYRDQRERFSQAAAVANQRAEKAESALAAERARVVAAEAMVEDARAWCTEIHTETAELLGEIDTGVMCRALKIQATAVRDTLNRLPQFPPLASRPAEQAKAHSPSRPATDAEITEYHRGLAAEHDAQKATAGGGDSPDEPKERVSHEQARDIIRIAWEGAFAGPRFEKMLRYIDQQSADANALAYWSKRARELEQERNLLRGVANELTLPGENRPAAPVVEEPKHDGSFQERLLANGTEMLAVTREALKLYGRIAGALDRLAPVPIHERSEPVVKEPDPDACHKCGGRASINDGDEDAAGPPVCCDCYDPDWRRTPAAAQPSPAQESPQPPVQPAAVEPPDRASCAVPPEGPVEPALVAGEPKYCAYGACVGPRDRNGLCNKHWSPPAAWSEPAAAQTSPAQEPACWCQQCEQDVPPSFRFTMAVCPNCGNKRCPKAEWHDFKCSGSNETGQVGVLENKRPGEPAAAQPSPAQESPQPPVQPAAVEPPDLRRMVELVECADKSLRELAEYFDQVALSENRAGNEAVWLAFDHAAAMARARRHEAPLARRPDRDDDRHPEAAKQEREPEPQSDPSGTR